MYIYIYYNGRSGDVVYRTVYINNYSHSPAVECVTAATTTGGTANIRKTEKGTREEEAAAAQRNWRFQNLLQHRTTTRSSSTLARNQNPFRVSSRIDLTPGIRRISGTVRRRDRIGMEGGGGGVPQEN